MNLLQKKLNSKRGASMILVLSLFLICVMVSSVILAAASSGISRNAQRVNQQRGYLAISSASDLLVEELDSIGIYSVDKITRKYRCADCNIPSYIYDNDGTLVPGFRLEADAIIGSFGEYDDGHIIVIEDDEDLPEDKRHKPTTEVIRNLKGLNGMFAATFDRACTYVFTRETEYTEEMIIKLSDSTGVAKDDERLPDVICQFKMDEDYNVKCVLYTEASDYAVSVSCNAKQPNETKLQEVDEDDDVHKVYYKKLEGGSYSTVSADWAIKVERSAIRTTIEWGAPRVKKEVLSR